jgi:hypothetical protein
MRPVAGQLTAAGCIVPRTPVHPEPYVAAYRTGCRKQRTVNPLIVPARYNFLYPSSRPALRAAASGGRPRPAAARRTLATERH